MRIECQLEDLGNSLMLTCLNCDLFVELRGRFDNPADVQAACAILKQRCLDCRELAVEYRPVSEAGERHNPVSSVES